MTKPEVQIKEWGVYGYPEDRRLHGVVIDHPRFDKDTRVITSKILTPSNFSNTHAGDKVETKNTIYILVGENENGSN